MSSPTSAVAVSMIVTGYNQSHLIDAAIESALAQTYPNLEIILTDDCSGDDTFERMRVAADRYRGLHRVIVHQPPRNLGTWGNIRDAFGRASGELIVFAGGDDLSYPHRVATLARRWTETRADALYSGFDIIDAEGAIIERDFMPRPTTLFLLDYFPDSVYKILYGATTACHRSVLERLPVTDVRIRSEDTYLTLMVNLAGGRIEFVREALIAYRQHGGAITNVSAPAADHAAIVARERSQMSLATSMAALLRLFLSELDRTSGPARLRQLVEDDIRMFDLKAGFDRLPVTQRIRAVPLARRRGEGAWLLPRVAGLRPFVAMKYLVLRWRNRTRPVRSPAGQ